MGYAVDIGSAAVFALIAASARSVPELVAFCWLAAIGIPLALIDAAVRRLPDALTMPALAGLVGVFAAAALTGGQPGALVRTAASSAGLAGFYLLLALIRPGEMGFGDVKLSLAVGAALGWLGWTSVIAGTFAAFLIAAAVVVILLVRRATDRRGLVPFGSFMLAGALVAVVVT